MAGLTTFLLLIPVVHMLTNVALLVAVVFLNWSSRARTLERVSHERAVGRERGTGKIGKVHLTRKAVIGEKLVSHMRTNHVPASKHDQLAKSYMTASPNII
jgi:hypothetical protein